MKRNSTMEEIAELRRRIIEARRKGEDVDALAYRLAVLESDHLTHGPRGSIAPGYFSRLSARC